MSGWRAGGHTFGGRASKEVQLSWTQPELPACSGASQSFPRVRCCLDGTETHPRTNHSQAATWLTCGINRGASSLEFALCEVMLSQGSRSGEGVCARREEKRVEAFNRLNPGNTSLARQHVISEAAIERQGCDRTCCGALCAPPSLQPPSRLLCPSG